MVGLIVFVLGVGRGGFRGPLPHVVALALTALVSAQTVADTVSYHYVYDDLNRLTTVSFQNDGKIVYDYDAAGNIEARSDSSFGPDTDQDDLSDEWEGIIGTNPNLADTDADGLSDGIEANVGTDPFLTDTDGDGFTDGEEFEAESDPLSIASIPSASGLPIWLIWSALQDPNNPPDPNNP